MQRGSSTRQSGALIGALAPDAVHVLTCFQISTDCLKISSDIRKLEFMGKITFSKGMGSFLEQGVADDDGILNFVFLCKLSREWQVAWSGK